MGIEARDVKCASCRGTFPANMMVQLGGRLVCAKCKNVVVRQMAGAVDPGRYRYAGFWIRFAAVLIDGIILFPASMVIVFALVMADRSMVQVAQLLQFCMVMAYYTFMHGKFGQTVGKMACGIKVIRADGSTITFGRAFGRYWAYILSGICLYIGYMMAGWDSQKRSLHDHICDTRVVYK